MSEALGIDIGGTKIKAGLVDTYKGQITTEIRYIDTPTQAGPEDLANTLARMIARFDWSGSVGIGYPGVVIDGHTFSAAHLSDKWIEADARTIFSKAFNNRFAIINDADAAGLAEMKFGAGQSMNEPEAGTVLMLTFGTGIGSALFCGGKLVPNTELGHLIVGIESAEDQASGKLKTTLGLDWSEWAERVNVVLAEYEKLFSPTMIMIGGGISENFDKFSGLLTARAKIAKASLQNDAGIVGAALASV